MSHARTCKDIAHSWLSAHPLAHTLVHSFVKRSQTPTGAQPKLSAVADPETGGPSPHTAALVCSAFREPCVCVCVCVCVCGAQGDMPSSPCLLSHVSPHSCLCFIDCEIHLLACPTSQSYSDGRGRPRTQTQVICPEVRGSRFGAFLIASNRAGGWRGIRGPCHLKARCLCPCPEEARLRFTWQSLGHPCGGTVRPVGLSVGFSSCGQGQKENSRATHSADIYGTPS